MGWKELGIGFLLVAVGALAGVIAVKLMDINVPIKSIADVQSIIAAFVALTAAIIAYRASHLKVLSDEEIKRTERKAAADAIVSEVENRIRSTALLMETWVLAIDDYEHARPEEMTNVRAVFKRILKAGEDTIVRSWQATRNAPSEMQSTLAGLLEALERLIASAAFCEQVFDIEEKKSGDFQRALQRALKGRSVSMSVDIRDKRALELITDAKADVKKRRVEFQTAKAKQSPTPTKPNS